MSDEIQALKRQSSDKEIAHTLYSRLGKPNHYEYDQTVLEASMAQIVRLFTTATPLAYKYISPALVYNNPNTVGKRCGFLDKDAQQ